MKRHHHLWVLAGLCASALLFFNTAARRADADIAREPRRHFEDAAVAAGRALAREAGAVPLNVPEGQERYKMFRARLIKSAQKEGIASWEFWRTAPLGAFVKEAVVGPRPSDDTGRSALLAPAFRLLGGVSPFLLTWLGALCAVPLFLWLAFEFENAGRPFAGAVLLLLLASSAHVVDALSLSYSAAGFGILSLLVLSAFSAYAVLHPSPRLVGLGWRTAAAGVLWATCILARGGALLVAGGFAVAILVGVARLRLSRRRGLVVTAALLALVTLPFFVVRPRTHHEVWLGMWEGLGDFDRTKGHTWADTEVRRVLAESGIEIPLPAPVWLNANENEAFFKERVLSHVREDPVWYAGILARRVAAVITQRKLLPRRAETGATFAPRSHPQEGAIDTYYSLAATTDVFGLGRHETEAPLWAFWIAPLALCLRAVRGSSPSRREALLLGVIAAGALAQPVLVTTAGAFEPQAFGIVYFLGAALVVGSLPSRRVSTNA